jgi:hypothetical protein
VATRLACLVFAGLLGSAAAAVAADRPYLVTNSAAAEEDEEQVWSVENWFRRAGTARSLTVAPEYAFDPVNSLQVEFRRTLDRVGENGHEVEVEYKHLFNRIARDGWGIGVVTTLDYERPQGGPWQRSGASLSLPFSLQFAEGAGLLHLNLGIAKPRGARREGTGAIAAEREVLRRTTLFAEAARDADGHLLHAGVRYWIRRERLAVDLAWQRLRSDGTRGSGLVLGIAWYDL